MTPEPLDDDELDAYYRMIEGRTRGTERPRRRRPPVQYVAPDCPTPEKIAYSTLAAVTGAILAITSSSRTAPSLRSYECVCGAWHLTRSSHRY